MNEPPSAIIVRIGVPPGIAALRRSHDPSARDGVPAHVTILFPFLPARALDRSVRRTLARIGTSTEPFDVSFASVATWPATVYLEPEPAEPFRTLTERIVDAFPAFPPYGGAHAEIVPHLTVADRVSDPLEPIVEAARRALPFGGRAAAVDVLATDPDVARWRLRWRIPLGGGSPPRPR